MPPLNFLWKLYTTTMFILLETYRLFMKLFREFIRFSYAYWILWFWIITFIMCPYAKRMVAEYSHVLHYLAPLWVIFMFFYSYIFSTKKTNNYINIEDHQLIVLFYSIKNWISFFKKINARCTSLIFFLKRKLYVKIKDITLYFLHNVLGEIFWKPVFKRLSYLGRYFNIRDKWASYK